MTTTEGPTIRTVLERLDALCGALDYRLRRDVHRDWTEALHPLLDLARIVRDLHRDAEPPQERPETAPEGDGTTDPVSGRETGAQRFKVGDRVQVRELLGVGAVLEADADGYCEVRHDDGGRVSTIHVSWLEPLPPAEPPTPAGVTVPPDASPTDSRFDAVGWKYGVRYHDGSVTAEWNGTTQRQHAVDLARLFPDAVVVRRRLNAEWQPAPADLTEVDPTPGPVDLPTTRGSVAWTRDGSVHGLTDDADAHRWALLAHDGPVRPLTPLDRAELLAHGVVRTFDASTGQVRVFDAGTVA